MIVVITLEREAKFVFSFRSKTKEKNLFFSSCNCHSAMLVSATKPLNHLDCNLFPTLVHQYFQYCCNKFIWTDILIVPLNKANFSYFHCIVDVNYLKAVLDV